jgi:hypothetical protein
LDHYVQVTIKVRVKTSFIQLVYPNASETTTVAVAHDRPNSPAAQGNSLVGLSQTSCDTVSFSGTSNVTVTGGNILSNSSASTSQCPSMSLNGSNVVVATGQIIDSGIYVQKGGSGTISPTPTDGQPHMLTDFIAAPKCDTVGVNGLTGSFGDQTLKKNQGSVTINPGIYGTIIDHGNANSCDPIANDCGTLTLSPGLYCITGDFSINGWNVKGTGVTIVMLGGTLNLNGSGYVALSAPRPNTNLNQPPNWVSTDGNVYDYSGMLIYADPTKYTPLNNPIPNSYPQIILGGNSGLVATAYNGTLYAPNTACTVGGTSSLGSPVTYNSQVLCNTVNVHGTTAINLNYNPDDNAHQPPTLSLEY